MSSQAPTQLTGRGFQVYRPDKIFRFDKWVKIHYWTENEDILLRREYKYSMESLRQLAGKLNVTEDSVRQRLARLGILRQAVRWTDTELGFMAENYDKYSNRVLSEKLHKSQNSVVAKAHRIGVKKRNRDSWFTKTEAASILGVDMGWITRRMKNGYVLAAQPFDKARPPSQGKHDSWMISERALRDFIRRYPEELTGHNVDFVMLVDILAGVM